MYCTQIRVGVDVVLPPGDRDQQQRHGDWPHVGKLLAAALETDRDWPDDNEAQLQQRRRHIERDLGAAPLLVAETTEHLEHAGNDAHSHHQYRSADDVHGGQHFEGEQHKPERVNGFDGAHLPKRPICELETFIVQCDCHLFHNLRL